MKRFILSKFIVLLLIIFINVCLISQCISQESNPMSSTSYLTLKVFGEEKTVRDVNTEVNVTKSVTATGSKLRFKYDIGIPPVDDYYFVLALDSSGSLGYGGNSKQGEAVVYAVPKFIKETSETYPDKNFSVSILSWDDDIDFAYGDLDNKIPSEAELVKIGTAQKELATGVFGEIDADGYYYRCKESDHTNLSKAIDASIAILKNNPENYYHRTSKFIILVTGASEYENCNEDLIAKAKGEGYPIFVIGMDLLDERSKMLFDLKRLTDNRKNRFQNVLSIDEDLNEGLRKALSEALKKATSEPVAENVTIVESLYSYIVPEENAYVKIIGLSGYDNRTSIIRNNDSTFTFTLPYGLLADNITEVTFDADLVLGDLPVSANEKSKPVIFSPASNNTRSYISYKWLKKEPIDFDLPDVNVDIRSGSSNYRPTNEEGSGDIQEPEVRSGYEFGFLTFICLSIIAMLKRKKI